MPYRQMLTALAVMLVLVIGIVQVFASHMAAQPAAGACPALVEQALEDLGSNCDGLDRNGACYGYNSVAATFNEVQPDDFFSTPADRAGLAALDTIQTVPLDAERDLWGIAVMNVQANIPNALPGQNVVFLLMGDVEVANEVAPGDALAPADPVTVTTNTGSNLRSSPTAAANLLGSAPAGTQLPADGLSPDGEWLRVMFENRVAWINRTLVNASGDLDGLPQVGTQSRTPMQAFSFRTGFGDPLCSESPPSLLVVQGPENLAVDITANGADIHIGSTIALRLLPNNMVQLIVVNGSATVDGVLVPAGFTMTASLGPDGTTIDGPWTNFRPLTEAELQSLLPLENIPGNILNYDIIIPTLADIQAALRAFGAAQSSTGPGATNGLPVCDNLRATSPLGGLPHGDTTFYWDGSPNITSYEVRVYNEAGQVVATFPAEGSQTSVTGNTEQQTLGGGFLFSWNVVALVDGQEVCSTSPVTMFREAPEPPPDDDDDIPSVPVCGNSICEQGEPETCYWDCQ